ncbi:MAG TPA: RodZ domain-containing protein [Methylomirabilota bacterium]|nr:RodZ domain-containing protein [Methylomirabilota bacterium]
MDRAAGLGDHLRGAREAQGLSVEALAARTRIAPRVVLALESGSSEALPAPVYVRGFIRAYCRELDLDPDYAVGLYDGSGGDEPPAAPAPRAAVATAPAGRSSRGPLVLAGIGVVVLAGVGLGLVLRHPAGGNAAVRALAPVPSAIPVAGPAVPSRGLAAVEHVLVMRADEATWVRIIPEGGSAREDLLQPGSVREWRSPGRFTITVGNAGGVRLELDGRALPSLGRPGEVVRDLVLPRGPSS